MSLQRMAGNTLLALVAAHLRCATALLYRPALLHLHCRPQIVDSLKRGHQVMVFVHSRKDTGKTGRILAELAGKNGETNLFESEGDDPKRGLAVRDVNK